MNEQPDAKSIFLAAVEKTSKADRDAFLDEACSNDAELRRRVEALLAAHDEPASFLDHPFVSDLDAQEPTVLLQTIREEAGAIIGPYKLLQELGQGGMGAVFMAEQTQPVRRKVALKIIKPGMDSQQVIARFEAERQALAMMDHQNIARILDAGMTETSRPYFVMELVKGVPITEYSDQNRLTPRERLGLFIPVCQAIQHAHQKGVIHRDIKPSNVLVSLYDGQPVPKVIDFGVAKAIEQRLTERTLFTQYGQIVGTLEYMSPEQAEMNQLDVDTRSDIYSLGVLLYELLTGSTPIKKEELREAGFAEMLRLIRETEPEKPSTRLSHSHEMLSTISAQRRTEATKLGALVRGELDWIVMKALEKDRTRRYESASDFARDIQRYLDDEPVEACPPSTSYRVLKFARKHRALLATVAAFAALLIVGVVVSAWQAVRATDAEAQARSNEEQALINEAKAHAATEAEKRAKNAEVEQRSLAEARELAAKRYLYIADLQLALQAWEANNPSRVLELLNRHHLEAGEIDLRGFEWHYLNRLCHSAKAILRDHISEVYCVCYTPDGKLIASTGTFDKTIRVRDSATGETRIVLKGHTDVVYQAAFTPDSRTLLSCSKDKTIRVWDVETGKILKVIKTGIMALGLGISADGSRVAVHGPQHIEVWTIETGEQVLQAESAPSRFGVTPAVVFGPKDELLAFAAFQKIDGELTCGVQLWDLKNNEASAFLQGHAKAVVGLAFSPDGSMLVSSSIDHTAKVWDVDLQKLLTTLTGHELDVRGVAFSPDGARIATGSTDKTIRIWDTQTGRQLQLIRGHTNVVNSVAFHPAERELVSGSKDKTVRIWSLEGAIEGRRFQADKKWTIHHLAFLADGTLATGSTGGGIATWNTTTGEVIRRFDGVSGETVSIGIIPRPVERLAASGTGTASIVSWNVETGEPIELVDVEAPSRKFAVSPEGTRMATIVRNGRVSVVNLVTGEQEFMDGQHQGPVFAVAWQPDGKRVATGSFDKTIRIWDTQTKKQIHKLSEHKLAVFTLAFNSDGSILASGSGSPYEMDQKREPATPGTICLWDMTKDIPTSRVLSGDSGAVLSLAFSPDDRTLASASHDQTVRLWDPVTGSQTMSFTGDSGYFRSILFSPDGTKLVAGAEKGIVYVWNAAPATPVQTK